jgi:hypothetical protein
MSDTPMKRCSKCGEEKPLAEFGKNKSRRDGLQSYCKSCVKINSKERRHKKGAKPRKTAGQCSAGMKICLNCGKEKAANAEHFHRHAAKPDGLAIYCKSCAKERGRRYRETNPEKVRGSSLRWYEANKDRSRENQRRWNEANKDRHQERTRRWYEANKDRKAETSRRRREANPEHYREYYRRYREANLERELSRVRRWRKENKDRKREETKRWREANPERARELTRRWRKANPEKAKATKHRRRARERNLPDVFIAQDWQRCLDYWQHRCAACGRPQGLWHVLSPDHWIALSDPRPDNPGTVATNIAPLCFAKKDGAGGCNNSKGDRDAADWLNSKFGATKAAEILERVSAYFEWVKQQPE